jgi:hypothetical protein
MENARAKKNLTLTPLPELVLPAPRAPVVEFTGTEEKSKKEEDGKKTEKTEKTENKQAASTYHGGRSMSLLETAREALVGIPADLLAGRGSLQEIFTKDNRLRGLGIILVLVAVFAAVSRLA